MNKRWNDSEWAGEEWIMIFLILFVVMVAAVFYIESI